MTLKEMILVRLQELDVHPKRSLGQNFLISEHVVLQIFNEFDRNEKDLSIEIGPGLGVLTEVMIKKSPKRLLIEMDRTFAEYWRSRGEQVIEMDALKADWISLTQGANRVLVIGNLPYQIGSRLVVDLSVSLAPISQMIFMFQKEVAERLVSKPRSPNYGFLSVVAQTFWNIQRVVDANSQDFYPAPKVDSRVMTFERRENKNRLGQDYIDFVKRAFQFRRKFMLKSFGLERAHLLEGLQKLGYNEKVRAEELAVNEFQELYRHFEQSREGVK